MRRILATIIAMTTGAAIAGGFGPISVRLKQNGVMCEVLNQITECSMLPDLLAQQFGGDRNILLVVTPEGCAESAIGQVRLIVDKLRAAGYTQVSVAGSLGKPNAKCAR